MNFLSELWHDLEWTPWVPFRNTLHGVFHALSGHHGWDAHLEEGGNPADAGIAAGCLAFSHTSGAGCLIATLDRFGTMTFEQVVQPALELVEG